MAANDGAAQHFKELTQGKKKPKMKRGDMLIACIALAHKALLVTRNLKDYRGVRICRSRTGRIDKDRACGGDTDPSLVADSGPPERKRLS